MCAPSTCLPGVSVTYATALPPFPQGPPFQSSSAFTSPQLACLQVRHLEGLQRTATQNAVAAKLLAATSARAAAAAAGAQQGELQGKAAAGSFKASLDFKTALACSTTTFYPCIVLKH